MADCQGPVIFFCKFSHFNAVSCRWRHRLFTHHMIPGLQSLFYRFRMHAVLRTNHRTVRDLPLLKQRLPIIKDKPSLNLMSPRKCLSSCRIGLCHCNYSQFIRVRQCILSIYLRPRCPAPIKTAVIMSYPFTEPAVIPLIIYFCPKRYTTRIGSIA